MIQKEILIKYLQDAEDWIPSYKLRSINTNSGFLGSQGDRRARELFEDDKIERKMIGKYVYYKAKKPVRIEKLFIPVLNKTIIRKVY